MKNEVRPTEASVLAVVSDEDFSSPELNPNDVAPLKRMAEAGQLFLMHTDDPVFYGLDIYVDEAPPEGLDVYFTERSGSFLLRAPTGRLLVRIPADRDKSQPPSVFTHGIEVPAGDYAVSVRDRDDVDLSAHRGRMEEAVGTSDWLFYERLNLVGAVGCLTIGLAGLLALVPTIRHGHWPLLLALALPTLVYHLMTRLPRYRRVKEVEEEPGRSLPVYLLVVKRVASPEGLTGGWYRD